MIKVNFKKRFLNLMWLEVLRRLSHIYLIPSKSSSPLKVITGLNLNLLMEPTFSMSKISRMLLYYSNGVSLYYLDTNLIFQFLYYRIFDWQLSFKWRIRWLQFVIAHFGRHIAWWRMLFEWLLLANHGKTLIIEFWGLN